MDKRYGTALNLDGDAIHYFLNAFKKDGERDLTDLENKAIDWFNHRFNNSGVSEMIYNISMSAPFGSDDPDLFDKIYLYNMFGYSKDGYDVCKSLEAAQSAERRSYIVTESNCTPYGVEGIKPWRPIPFVIKAGETNTDIVINHSLLNSEKDTVVYIGANSVSALDARRGGVLSVKYNGVECEYLGISKKSYMKEETSYGFVLTFKVPKESAEGSTKGALAITANQFVTVSFLELMNGDGDIL